jgi:branched-chain amino acid transport system permease protein
VSAEAVVVLEHAQPERGGGGVRLLTPRRTNIFLVALALGVLPVVTSHLMPLWFTNSRAELIGIGATLAVAAISLNILMGYAGQISLGHAALLGTGAFTSAYFTSRLGLPMVVGMGAGAVLGGAVAFLIGIPALRLRGLYLAIITLVFTVVMSESIFRWPQITGGSAGVEMPRRLFGDNLIADYSGDLLAILLLILLLAWLLDVNVTRTRIGRALRALKESEPVAQAFGINVSRHKLLAFTLSGALAGVAGAMYGHISLSVNNEVFTFERLSLPLIIIVVVGGLGSRAGVVIAAFAFTLFPQLLTNIPYLSEHRGWDIVVGSALLMYTVARHPGGFAEVIQESRERRRKRKLDAAAADAAGPATASSSTDDDEDDVAELGHIPRLPVMPRPAALREREAVSGPVLSVSDLTVRFGGLVAVDGASLEVGRGQIVGLIGPNGAGKSTLFNAVSGLVKPESGVVRFMGEEIQRLAAHERARRGIARTFQQVGLAKSLSVFENFLLAQNPVAAYGTASGLLYLPKAARVERELSERAEQAIAALGFEEFHDTAVRNLSGGQQRIVEMACALVSAPDLLMLDEPSAGMAPGAAENLAVRLRDLRDEFGRTVLLIEHNVPLVLDVCDYIYVLNYGSILAHGTTEMIARQPEVIGAYFGEAVA